MELIGLLFSAIGMIGIIYTQAKKDALACRWTQKEGLDYSIIDKIFCASIVVFLIGLIFLGLSFVKKTKMYQNYKENHKKSKTKKDI